MPNALIVDDSGDSRSGLAEWLARRGFGRPTEAASVDAARDALAESAFDLVLLDLELPDGNGLELLDALTEHPDTEVVIITGHGSVDSAVEAIRGGAVDYLTKPVDLQRLEHLIRKLQRTIKLREEVHSLRSELRSLGRFGSMVGSSPEMQRVYDLITRVAPTDSSVLILGETGTGKELVAETVHQLSQRADGPFVPINCGAVAPNLIESELFGHERGSFTGAERQHIGIFERADHGTLFLDEITETPSELQVKLLRVLESGKVTRVGGTQSIDADARVIAATNRIPHEAVREGTLRKDLLYRLNVFPIEVPPLRARKGDVDLLSRHFLHQLNRESGQKKRFTPAAARALGSYSWPGNVRELSNTIERAFIVAGNDIDRDALSLEEAPPLEMDDVDGMVSVAVGSSIADAERKLILATLERIGGDKKKTADALGISTKTLYNRLTGYRESD